MPATREWFVDEGRRYPKAYATTPLCCPSRASIFTGRYAHNHGVRSNEVGPNQIPGETWFSSHLNNAGYHTGIFGKVMNSWDYTTDPPGFDAWTTFPNGYYDSEWNVNGTMRRIENYSTTFIQSQAQAFLSDAEEDDDQPWYLHLTPNAPHAPFIAAPAHRDARVGDWAGDPAVLEGSLEDKPPWLQERVCGVGCGRGVRRQQFRTLMSVDDMVDALRVQLEEMGETNTLAIYTSDNGYLWGDHGRKLKGQPWTGSVTVPFYMRWPAHVGAGEVVKDVALNIDIAPTLLDAAEISPPAEPVIDGRSLLSSEPRDRTLLEHWCSNRGCDYWASTRTATYQYIERYDENGERIFREYYDLREDPWQLRNVFHDGRPGNSPEELREIVDQLHQDRTCVGAACP